MLPHFYFTKFKLEKVSSLTTFVRNGNSADRQSEEGITDNKPSEGMNKGCFAEYDITIPEDGYYALNFEGATVSGVNAEVSLTVGDITESVTLCGKGWYSPVWMRYSTVYLNAGTHTFRIQITSEAIRLFGIIIRGIEKNTAKAFLEEVKNADVKSLGAIFEKYDRELANSYNSLTKSLIYKDFCYMRILGANTDDFAEFDKNAMHYIIEEIQTPLVSVLYDGKSVSCLPSGNFDVVFSEKLDKNFTAAVALYDKERNQLEYVKLTKINPCEETTLEGLCAEGDEDLRIFFWQNEKKPSPGRLPVNDSYIYVSETGNDDASGTLETPIKTVKEAVMRVNSLNDSGDVTVAFLPGEYFVSETVSLDETDGGKGENTVTYKSFDKKNPAVIW